MFASPNRVGRLAGQGGGITLLPIGSDLMPVPTLWVTTAGAGATFSTVDGPPRVISITAAGATSSIRVSTTVATASWYRMTWSVLLSNMFLLLGTTNGGAQYKSAASSQPIGTYTFDFLTTSTALWLQFQRTGTGVSEARNMTLFKLG
jgi:hypothetical protein